MHFPLTFSSYLSSYSSMGIIHPSTASINIVSFKPYLFSIPVPSKFTITHVCGTFLTNIEFFADKFVKYNPYMQVALKLSFFNSLTTNSEYCVQSHREGYSLLYE